MLKKFLWWIPSICMMVMIFRFSMDTGEESSSISSVISDYLNISEFLVRKTAHITEYFLLTLSLALPFRFAMGLKKKRAAFFMAAVAFIYASSDEIHQLFVGGRSGSFKDVMIDSIGIFLSVVVFLFLNRKKIV